MKIHYFLIILFLAVGHFTACKKNDSGYADEYQKSNQNWLNFKTSSGNSYRYITNTGSWTGATTETIIIVESGKVTHRSFVIKTREQNSNALIIREKWDEDVSTLNTHANGGAAITLDEIYQKAKTEWLLKRKNATIYFETKNNGMISSCGYTPEDCVDDCFFGIHISLIEKL